MNMDGKRGAAFLLLGFCAALAACVEVKSNLKIRETAQQLMKKCKQTGHRQPDLAQLLTAMDSDVSAEEANPDGPSALLSTLATVFQSVSLDNIPSKLLGSLGRTGSRAVNSTTFKRMIRKMKTTPDEVRCYVAAVMSPMSWDAITNKENANMDAEEYSEYVSAAGELLEIPSRQLDLPESIDLEKMKILMNTLTKKYNTMSEKQRKEVIKWAKDKILKDCTRKGPSGSGKCEEWLTSPVVSMIGPFVSGLPAAEIQGSPKAAWCVFFKSEQFGLVVDDVKVNPSWDKMLLSKIKDCEDFLSHLDKLGRLVCYYNPRKLTQEQTQTLTPNILRFKCPGKAKWRKHLTQSITRENAVDTIQKLGKAAKYISKKHLDLLGKEEVLTVLKNPDVRFTRRQMKRMVKTYLEDSKCRKLSEDEVQSLTPALAALPKCFFKKTMEMLLDPKWLKNTTLKKSQAADVANELLKKQSVEELVETDVSEDILQAIPADDLTAIKPTSWGEITKKNWIISQVIPLVNSLQQASTHWFRDSGSLTSGVTCETVKKTDDKNIQEMVDGFATVADKLSKTLAKCTAEKLFETLKSKTITRELLSSTPAVFFIHISPNKVKDLPDSLCPDFLDKMSNADLRTLPWGSPSRSGLRDRALRCQNPDVSKLSSENMMQLGQLLCEVSPAQLRRMRPEVQRQTLQAMASCDHTPKKHREGLVQLVKEAFGDPSKWADSEMEKMGHLLFLDEKTWPHEKMKSWLTDVDVTRALAQRLPSSVTLKKHLFKLITSNDESESVQSEIREKRARPNNNGNNKPQGGHNTNTTTTTTNTNTTTTPTADLIEALEEMNVNWTPEQLDNMTLETFTEAVEVLGSVTNYCPRQLDVLREKAVEAWGKASNMSEKEVMQLGCIAQGFEADELMTMAFSQSSLADIAACGWNKMKIPAVWKGVAKHNGLSAESLDTHDMVDLDLFICGLSATEIQQLNTTAFMKAVASMNKVKCSAKVFQQFKAHAVKAFGKSSSWTEKEVAVLGTFIVGLNADELSSLKISVFPFLSPESIPLIAPSSIAALSVKKLLAFGPDNAALVSNDQKKALTKEQRAAISEASGGSRDPNNTGHGSNTTQKAAADFRSVSSALLVSCFLAGLAML